MSNTTMHNAAKAYSYLRMSTQEQLKGDSFRRQLELSKDYAKENNLVLSDCGVLTDTGLSAYSGKNLHDGALGCFLDAIKRDKVKKGSFLLVESLDRISRRQILEALSVFMAIIDAGITIVTLSDNMSYSRESINDNWSHLIVSLTIMSRAYEESNQKSIRLKSAWNNKRSNIHYCKLTSICPAWLKLSDDKTKFYIIEHNSKIVQRIFNENEAGIGNHSIARRLNQDKTPTFGRSRGWHSSYIQRVITNRAVIGEFQPHAMSKGKRVPIGRPIENYYPSIISRDQYYRVQLFRRTRKTVRYNNSGGTVSNLFSGILFCRDCASRMALLDKGKPPKGGKYLVCYNAFRGVCCNKHYLQYAKIERLLLIVLIDYFEEDNSSDYDPQTISSDIHEITEEINVQLKKQKLLIDNFDDPDQYEAVKNKLDEIKLQLDSFEDKKNNLHAKYSCLVEQSNSDAELVNLIAMQLSHTKCEDAHYIRSKIHSFIINKINRIDLFASNLKEKIGNDTLLTPKIHTYTDKRNINIVAVMHTRDNKVVEISI